jgi:hypothetical protein
VTNDKYDVHDSKCLQTANLTTPIISRYEEYSDTLKTVYVARDRCMGTVNAMK